MTESRTYPSPDPTATIETTIDERTSSVWSEPRQTLTTDAMQRQVFELVRARVLESIGAEGNWTVSFRRSSDTDTFFSETMADMIAWDVAAQLLPPVVPNRPRLVA